MNCHNCARQTLSLFIRSFTSIEPAFAPRQHAFRPSQPSRFISTDRQLRRTDRAFPRSQRPTPPTDVIDALSAEPTESYERPSWQAQKAALKEKLNGEAWNPRKKLSPDTMEGIRHLHSTQPERFTTPMLADHFKVSPEAIRRILKSKWQPNDTEHEARMERWDKRGERIWSNLVEMGVKPPKKWREMGVGRAMGGERPRWKGRRRLDAGVGDSRGEEFRGFAGGEEDIIPTVGGRGQRKRVAEVSLAERI